MTKCPFVQYILHLYPKGLYYHGFPERLPEHYGCPYAGPCIERKVESKNIIQKN